jgi:hypothetical protein
MMEESPIFTKTYDLLLWLIPTTQKFPALPFLTGKRVKSDQNV